MNNERIKLIKKALLEKGFCDHKKTANELEKETDLKHELEAYYELANDIDFAYI